MAGTVSKKRVRREPATPRARSASRDEHLKELMKQAVREVLMEERWTTGDPDAGLEVRPEILADLEEQKRQVAGGEAGEPLANVIRDLKLD